MATAIQRRRGTAAQHSSFTGLAGEITIDTTNNTVVVHDGSTAGGHRLAKYSEITALGEGDITAIVAGAGLTGDATSGDATLAVGAGYGITVNANDIELTNSSVRALFSASGDLSYNSTSGAFSFTNDAGDIESVTAGSGLTGGGTSGAVTLNIGAGTGITVAADDISTDDSAIVHDDLSGFVANEHIDHSGVTLTAGTGLTGGGDITASRTFNVVGGNGITANANDVAVDVAYFDVTASGTGWGANLEPSANNTYSLGSATNYWKDLYVGPGSLYINGQQVLQDSSGTIQVSADSNQNVQLLTAGSGDIELNASGTGVINIQSDVTVDSGQTITGTGGLTFGSNINANSNHINNLANPVAAQDGATKAYVDAGSYLNVTDAGGDGSLSVSGNTFTYTGPSASEVRAHFSGGTGVTITDGSIAIGQAVNTGSDVTFNDMTVAGNLTVSGTTTTVNTATLAVADNIVVLNNGTSGSPSENAGLQVDRGSSSDVFLRWNETGDYWEVTRDGSSYEKIYTEAEIEAFFSASDAGGDGSLTYSSGVFTYTGPSASEVQAHFSATDAGGDGSFSYSNGVYTYTGPSAAEVRAHFSGGTGITLSSGEISVTAGSIGATELEATTVTAGVYGSTTNIPVITVDADGRLTSASNSAVAISHLDTGDLSEGSNQYFTTARANSAIDAYISGGTGITVSSGAISLSDTGLISGVTAGTGLSGGGSSGNVTLNVSGLTVSELAADSLQTSGESFSNDDTSLMTSAAIEDKILSYGYTTTTGDITGVTAGTGLSGGGSSGSVTLNVDLSELTDMTQAVSSSEDELIILDNGADRRKLISEIPLSAFNNDSGFTSNTGDITGVTAGTGLSGGGSSGDVSLALDMSELTDMTAAMTGSDEFIVLDAGADRRKAASEIGLSIFNNDSGFTTNVGDITGVTAGTNLNGGGSSGSVTLNLDTALTGMASAAFSGNVSASYFVGTATQAQYADLAEKYTGPEDLVPGDVVCFGGDLEVEACGHDSDHRVAGVISTEPAYMMNSDADGHYVALVGRVPCKVTGPIAKGDLLVTSEVKGHAKADNNAVAGRIIGKAIGSSEGGEAVVEVLVNLQ